MILGVRIPKRKISVFAFRTQNNHPEPLHLQAFRQLFRKHWFSSFFILIKDVIFSANMFTVINLRMLWRYTFYKRSSGSIHFLRARARSGHFSVVQTTRNVIPRNVSPGTPFSSLLQNRKMTRIAHFWSKSVISYSIAPTLLKTSSFFGLQSPILAISVFGRIPHFGREHSFAPKMKRSPQAPWKQCAEFPFLESGKRQDNYRLRNAYSIHF